MTTNERRPLRTPSESPVRVTTSSLEARRRDGAQVVAADLRPAGGALDPSGVLAADVGQYLGAVFGNDVGTVFLAVGSAPYADGGRYKHGHWTELRFAWPAQEASLVRAVLSHAETGSDVYVCPYL